MAEEGGGGRWSAAECRAWRWRRWPEAGDGGGGRWSSAEGRARVAVRPLEAAPSESGDGTAESGHGVEWRGMWRASAADRKSVV